jgi:hypothetical protein
MNIKNIPIHRTNYSTSKSNKKGVVMHWMAGRMAGATARFQQPNQLASAHYGIANNEVVRWVLDEEIAYHAGVSLGNVDYIGIEHEGGWLLGDNTRQKPTRETHDTSAHLLANLSAKYGWGKLEYKKNVFKHSDFKATECCGSLDVDYIINKANELLNNNDNDMEKREVKAIVESLYWSFGKRQPDTDGVNFWIDEYFREGEKAKWTNRILEGLRKEKVKQGIRFLDADLDRWRTKEDILAGN